MGENYRKEFFELGDACSLIPETIQIMAFTTAATRSTRQAVIKVLKMVHPVVVSISPNKSNIKYHVKANTHSLEETFSPLVEDLRKKMRVAPLYSASRTCTTNVLECLLLFT